MSPAAPPDTARILVLGHQGRGIDFSSVYQLLESQPDVTVHVFNQKELKRLRWHLATFDFSPYRAVILDLPFRRVYPTARSLRRLPGLVIYEEDAYQNFITNTRWQGKFEAAYRHVPGATIVFTGHNTAHQFEQLGIKARFLPKGFNQDSIYPENTERDIAAGFIGRTRSQVYSQRAAILETLAERRGVQLMRTSSIDEYRQTLNRIRIFVSADIGMHEYMAKNFEAMACGCTLLAYRQGGGEEEALGFRDMENVVLYDDLDEATEKLDLLQSDPELCSRIGQAGQELVRDRHRHSDIAEALLSIARETAAAPRTAQPHSAGWGARLRQLFTSKRS